MSPRRTRATGPWAAAITLFAPLAAADQAPVSIDGALGDWALVPVAYTDAADGGSGVDFGRLWIADD
ncbi:MAG: hypothetical protein ACYTF4_18315, partial [Planctomycetota bacterium]